MRRTVGLVFVGVLLLAACGGDEDGAAQPRETSATDSAGEPIVIRTKITIADEEGAEPIATGTILEGSTLGGSPFCADGSILDTHASADPVMEPYGLIDRTITCPDGTVRMGYSPTQTQTVPWTIVSGTGAFEGVSGSGEREIVYGPDGDSPARETFTGTITRSP